jgi:hypothetical protein
MIKPFCMIPTVDIMGIEVTNPLLAPGALLGVVIGIYAFMLVTSLTVEKNLYNTSVVSYATMFILFALMNFSAIFADCLFVSYWSVGVPGNNIPTAVAFIDAFFSSMVDYSFILCGLTDIGIVNRISNYVVSLCLGWVGIFCGYLLSFAGIWQSGFTYLYSYLALVGMVVFALCSLPYTFREKTMSSLMYVGIAIISGLLGFWILSQEEQFCVRNPFLNSYVLWFLCSDAALASICSYYMSSRKLSQ